MANINENKIPHGIWRQLNPGCWARECVGSEQAVSYNQNVRDGHTELTIEVLFSTSLSTWGLIQLPQMMQFEQLQSDADAAEWLQETLHVVTDQSAHEVSTSTYSRRLPTEGKRNMLYLVTAPAADYENPTRHALVWNVGHIFADAFSIVQFVNYFLQTIAQVDDGNLTMDQLDYADVLGRLPVTPVTVYEEKYKPTREQRQQAVEDAIRQGELYVSKMPQSIAMYPETDVTGRIHATHCIRLKYTLEESEALLAQLRDDNLSITYAAAAATLLAVKQMYTHGHETGALLGMTRNARRWIDTLGHHEKGGPVPSAADVVFLWIPFETHWFHGSTRNTVLVLGRAIRTELRPHLASPHYLASLSFTSDRVVANLAREQGPISAPCAPGFSSQGALALKRKFCSNTTSIEIHDFSHTGRQINVSPWVGMFSLWNQITLSLGFNSKYHDPIAMDSFMALVQSNLRSVILPSTSFKL